MAWLTLDDPQRHAMDATFQDITALSGLAPSVVTVSASDSPEHRAGPQPAVDAPELLDEFLVRPTT